MMRDATPGWRHFAGQHSRQAIMPPLQTLLHHRLQYDLAKTFVRDLEFGIERSAVPADPALSAQMIQLGQQLARQNPRGCLQLMNPQRLRRDSQKLQYL